MKISLLVACLVIVANLTSCFDCQPPSLPITESWASGLYVPNHSGVETLRVRLDHVWSRSYYYPDGKVAVDSGKWELLKYGLSDYQLGLDDFFHRNPEWAQHFMLPDRERRYDGMPTEPFNKVPDIRNDFGRIRIEIFWMDDLGWYDKVGSLPDSS